MDGADDGFGAGFEGGDAVLQKFDVLPAESRCRSGKKRKAGKREVEASGQEQAREGGEKRQRSAGEKREERRREWQRTLRVMRAVRAGSVEEWWRVASLPTQRFSS